MLVWNAFLISFSALLPLINPLGSAFVFMGLAGEAPARVYHSIARKIAINNIVFLGIFELLGSSILRFFGISLPIVQVAGGIVIAAIGWSVLQQNDSDASTNAKREEAKVEPDTHLHNLADKAFYPFTFPVTSGPGTLVVLLTLSARLSSGNGYVVALGHLGIFLACIVLSLLVYLCYANAPRITRLVPPATAHGILRVVAFILLCIGVQIAWNGAVILLKAALKP